MHWILLPLAATASLAAPDDAAAPAPLPPAYVPCEGTVPVFNPDGCPEPGLVVTRPETADDGACRDTIRLVRDAAGQPPLETLPTSPEDPYMIAAVDKRVGHCAMMQMHGNAADLRPLPARRDGGALLHRAN